MKIIKERKHVSGTLYDLRFDVEGTVGSAYRFPCTKDGDVILSSSYSGAEENLRLCRTGLIRGERVSKGYIDKWENNYNLPAIGMCERCDNEVDLTGFTNTCNICDADYNLDGQLLAPRSQWGEETGETASNILGPSNGDEFFDE